MTGEPTELYRNSQTAAFRVQDLIVVRNTGHDPPSKANWSTHMRVVQGVLHLTERWLILPSEAGLTPSQRSDVRVLANGYPMAILTSSIANRCIMRSLSWFAIPICGFAPGEYRKALQWLDREPLLTAVLRGLEQYSPLTWHNGGESTSSLSDPH